MVAVDISTYTTYTEGDFAVIRIGLMYFVYDQKKNKQIALAADYAAAVDVCNALNDYEYECPECGHSVIDQDGNKMEKCHHCYAMDFA